MKVLWVTNIVLPECARALGIEATNFGGWMPSLLQAIRCYAPQLEISVIAEGPRDAECCIDGVSYYLIKSCTTGRFNNNRNKKKQFCTRISNIINSKEFSLIHFHGTEYGYLSLPAWVWGNVPKIVSLQGIINGSYQHYLGGLTDSELRPYRNWLRWLLSGFSLQANADRWREVVAEKERISFRNIKHVAGRTSWDRDWALALLPSAVYHKVGEVLRSEFYCQEGAQKTTGHKVYASAALAYPLKGGHWLLRAIAIIKKKYPDVEVRFADSCNYMNIKGLKRRLRANEYHRYLHDLITKLDIEGNVTFLPSLSAKDVSKELIESAVFCLPSLIENSPNSLCEAMMCGTPIVACAVGGIPSIVKDRESALLCSPADPAALAARIIEIFENPSLARCIANKAKKDAETRFNPQLVVQELVDAYNAVCGFA